MNEKMLHLPQVEQTKMPVRKNIRKEKAFGFHGFDIAGLATLLSIFFSLCAHCTTLLLLSDL